MAVYEKYNNLLDNTSNEDISEFLKEKHSLEEFAKVIRFFKSESSIIF